LFFKGFLKVHATVRTKVRTIMAKPLKNHSYLTRNSAGTFVFQIRIPTYIKRLHPHLKSIVRCSLRTKDHPEAIRRSRSKLLMFDLAIQHYANPIDFESHIQMITADSEWRHLGLPLVPNSRSELVHGSNRVPEVVNEATPLKVVAKEFLSFKRNSGVRAASFKWYSQKVDQFINIVEAISNQQSPTDQSLTLDVMRQYASVMQSYPKHASTRPVTKNMTIKELVALVIENGREGLAKMGIDVVSYQTVGHNFTAIREFLRFAERNQRLNVQGLADILVSPKKKRGSKPQVKFSANDLKTIFHSNEYRNDGLTRSSDYWLPLLAAFGGQTQAELCQLHVDDIKSSNGIWYMDINDQHEKLLKNESGRPRQVPIHHQLLNLGFLEFVESCRLSKQVRLFPQEIRNENDKYPGYSKRFNRWRKRLGIITDSNGGRKTFHSFRHLVSDWLVGNQCHPGVAADIIGHEGKERLETRRTYSDGAWLDVKNEWIQKIDYGIDLSHLKRD
jgi:integrase